MDPAIIGVFIPIIAISGAIPLAFYGVWTAHKQKLAKMEMEARKHAGGGSGELAKQQAGQIRELQERVQVLERIVTDGGYDLATQIEALRDARQIESRLEAAESEGRV